MNFFARAAALISASVLVGAAVATDTSDRRRPAPSTEPATATQKGDKAPMRSDRLERDVVEREVKRRSAVKAPVMPAERS